MADKYPVGIFPGERAEKTVVRAFVYSRAIKRFGLNSFRTGHHLVLGGAGGDISLLLAAGVAPDHIHVAELQAPVCRVLRTKFPEVPVHREDALLTLARNWDSEFSTINLDLCRKLSTATIKWVDACLRNAMQERTMMSVTLCGSREIETDIMRDIERLKNQGYDSAHARCEVLHLRLREQNIGLHLGPYIGYKSLTKTATGAPHVLSMCTSMFYYGTSFVMSDPYAQFGNRIDQRELALDLRKDGLRAPEVAAMLSLPRQQVAGWFAVDTKRG